MAAHLTPYALPVARADRPDWYDRAECRGLPSAWWISERGDDSLNGKEVCGVCPVRAECLEYAVADPSLIGIWGGTSPKQRVAIRRERASK